MSPYNDRAVSGGVSPGGGDVGPMDVRVPGLARHLLWHVLERRSVGYPVF